MNASIMKWVCLALMIMVDPGFARGGDTPSAPPLSIEGTYTLGDGESALTVHHIAEDIYRVECTDGWEGAGILDGQTYRGVFKYRSDADTCGRGKTGRHIIDWKDADHPIVKTTEDAGRHKEVEERWRRVGEREKGFIYDPFPDEPPIRSSVPTRYPESALKAGIQGTVVVEALVLPDGSVGATRVKKSIPMLDEAAVTAVMQYRFKKFYSARIRPCGVWFAIPIRFTLH